MGGISGCRKGDGADRTGERRFQVVLSDEEIWTVAQLNDTAWCRNDEELDWYYNPDMEGKEKFKKESWYRVFEIDQAPHVQATFWELRKEEVKKIWKYNK